MALLDLQAMDTHLLDTDGGHGGHSGNSSAGGSCADSNVSITLCHESGLSALLCNN